MALAPRPHGVKITEVAAAGAALIVTAASVWGMVCWADDADPDVFPLDKPVLVTDIEAAIAAAGETGTLRTALQAIAVTVRAVGVVVRIAAGEGEDDIARAADLALNAVGAGTAGARTGMQALLDAESVAGVRPRILAVPGVSAQAVGVALGVLAGRLGGVAYFQPGPIRTVAAATAAAAAFSARELFLIFDDFLIGDTISHAVAHAVALRARLDREVGYHKTISNVPVPGVTGIETPVSWDLQSEDTEVGLLNGANITGLIRRDGFRFWGNRGCSADPRYAFEAAVRTNQALRDTIVAGVFPYIDQPLTPALARDVIESINALFRREKSAGRIIGAEAVLAEGNTSEGLAAGKLRIGYSFTPCAPLEELGVETRITDEFYADFARLAA